MLYSFYFILLVSTIFNAESQLSPRPSIPVKKVSDNPYAAIAAIPLPPGFTRTKVDANSFAAWLRKLPLKKNTTVYLYNGQPKANQQAQFAVIDISVGKKDLQQCADAIMRLRAEYLYERKDFAAIDFTDNNHTHYRLPVGASRAVFDKYLEKVFAYCGTASLEKQLLPVADFKNIQAGDVLIKGGSPGHAMLVVDEAENKKGEKIYLLAQSYMPAQDIQVVTNPTSRSFSPWYEAGNDPVIETPEWNFATAHCLRKWPKN